LTISHSLFPTHLKEKTLRNAFSIALIQAAQADERVILLTGDHGYSLFDEFRRLCPPRQYINAGVAEQNMVGVAAGLAKAGLRPVVYGLSAFVPMRVLEQIKLDVCYERLPVVFMGDGAGIVYTTLGASHQCTEDIAALRALPNLAILSPADAWEMSACMDLALHADGPVYVRMGKADLESVHGRRPELTWGNPLLLRDGYGPLGWIATGSMTPTAVRLSSRWPGSAVWSVPCLKPMHELPISRICERHRALVCLEEHSVHGGLGSAVAELATSHMPVPICRVGIRDRFSRACGSYAFLLAEHGLDDESIVRQVQNFVDSLPEQSWNSNRRSTFRLVA
ncbi:MAG TPA: transketolase C-terminal domain-containing protein, partial [Gemmataceae bacterium]|nr:transketolase C-terminal domain-containing protein [Gemmataceae bacterium]